MSVNEWNEDKFTFKIVEKFEEPLYTRLTTEYLGASYPWQDILSEAEEANRKKLEEQTKGLELRLAVYDRDKLAALSYGLQTSSANFLMGISLVLPEYRRQGLYTLMLKSVIKFTNENGFQTITSHHKPSNPAILIAKLKAGFVISGIDMSDMMGTLIRLTYFHSEKRKSIFKHKVN